MRAEIIHSSLTVYLQVFEALKDIFPELSEKLTGLIDKTKQALKLYTLINVPTGKSFADIYDSRQDYLCYLGATGNQGIFEKFSELYTFCKKENAELQGLTEKDSNKLFVYSSIDFQYNIKTKELRLNNYKSLIEISV
jgi:hypothetical protein